MARRNKKSGRKADSPVPRKNTTIEYSPGLHKLESESRKLLKKATEKQRKKWKPISESTVELVMAIVEKHKVFVCDGMNSADVKIMDEQMALLTTKLEEAFMETLAPSNTKDYKSLKSDIHHHTKSLEEDRRTLRELQQNISKLQRTVEKTERELEALETAGS